MTSLSSSSSSRSTRSQSILPWLVLVVAIPVSLLAGCADKHIGRPCEIGSDTGGPTMGSVNNQALECPSRLCLLPVSSVLGVTAGPMCTDFCSSDDDCSDGEKYHKDSNPKGCKAGFACRTPFEKLDNIPIACKQVCVCRDFLDSNQPNIPPPSCR